LFDDDSNVFISLRSAIIDFVFKHEVTCDDSDDIVSVVLSQYLSLEVAVVVIVVVVVAVVVVFVVFDVLVPTFIKFDHNSCISFCKSVSSCSLLATKIASSLIKLLVLVDDDEASCEEEVRVLLFFDK